MQLRTADLEDFDLLTQTKDSLFLVNEVSSSKFSDFFFLNFPLTDLNFSLIPETSLLRFSNT